MFHQVWYFLLICLIEQVFPNEIKQLTCASKAELDDIIAANHFKRFIKHNEKIYFVFEHQIIFSKIPELFKDNLNNLKDEFTGSILFENYNFFEQTNQEIDLPHSIPNNSKILGHSFDLDTNKTLEFYYVDDVSNQFHRQIFDQVYELDFTGNVFAERKQLKKVPDFLRSHLVQNESTIKYMNSFLSKNYHILTKLYQSKDRKDSLSILLQKDFSNKTNQKNYSIIIQNFDDFKSFITNFNFDQIDNGILEGLFIAVNRENSKINPINFNFTFDFNSTKNDNYLNIKDQIRIELNLEELFSCFVPFTDASQVKGIYFNSSFFIFINRFYLKIESDLISTGFHLEKEVYSQNAKNLKFENDEIYSNVKFENLKRKYIKSYPNAVYFVPSSEDHFGLSVDQNRELSIKKETKSEDNMNCLMQTLIINGTFFCFNDNSYYDSKRSNQNSIENIFKNSFLRQIYKNQKLKFIFNYHHQVVFLTQTDLFVFKYENFKIDLKKAIIFSNVSNYEPIIIKNCLFICDGQPTMTSERTSSSIILDDKVDSGKYIILGLVFLTISVLLIIFYLLNKKIRVKIRTKKLKHQPIKRASIPSSLGNKTLSNDSTIRQMKSEQSATLLSKSVNSIKSNSSLAEVIKLSSLLTKSVISKKSFEQVKAIDRPRRTESLSFFFKLNKGSKKVKKLESKAKPNKSARSRKPNLGRAIPKSRKFKKTSKKDNR